MCMSMTPNGKVFTGGIPPTLELRLPLPPNDIDRLLMPGTLPDTDNDSVVVA